MRARLPLPPGDVYNVTVTACTESSRNTSTPTIIRLGGHFFSSCFFLSCHQFFLTAFLRCVCVSEPAPPRSLHAVNATHSSVTLLWAEEGVVDYYQVLCKASGGRKELKVTTVRQSWVGAPQRPWWPAAASHVLFVVSLFSVSSRCLFQAGEPQMVSSQMVTVTGLMPSSTYNCTITSFSYSSTSKPAHISITTAGRWRCAPTPGSAAWSPTTFFMCTQQKK